MCQGSDVLNQENNARDLQAVADELKTQGIVTIEGVFSSEEMQTFRGLLDRTISEASHVETYKGRPTDKLLGKSKDTVWLLWELYAVCEGGLRFSRHPAIVSVLERALGEPVRHASIGTMFDKVAGGDAEIGWHQDTFFIVDPPKDREADLTGYWTQFGHVHVRPADLDWKEDYFRKTIIVRINVDPQTIENGAMKVLPGSYLEGPLELATSQDGQDDQGGEDGKDEQGGQDGQGGQGGLAGYVAAHAHEAIDCTAGEGSVTFYYPTMLHSSEVSKAPPGVHRRAAAHRVRAESLEIPGWDWPTDWPEGAERIRPASGFDLDPFS